MIDKIVAFFKQLPRVANAALVVAAAVLVALAVAKISGVSDEFIRLVEAVLSSRVVMVGVIAAAVVWAIKLFEKQIGDLIPRTRKVGRDGVSFGRHPTESAPETVASPPVIGAFDGVKKKAETGDSEAQFVLACMYDTGSGILQDHATAAEWYRRAADQGNAGAQNNLGFLYASGKGVPLNYAEAAKWYRRAAEHGNPRAQSNLGSAYHEGRGVPRNLAEAAKWYRRAAEQGNAGAQNNLGVMYDRGEGVPDDPAKAAELYRRAAEQNDARAQFNLARLYVFGEGFPRDYREAYVWLSLAATNGHPTATEHRDNFAADFSPTDLAELQAEAVKRFEEIRRKRAKSGK